MFKSTFVNPENLTQNFILTHWLNNTTSLSLPPLSFKEGIIYSQTLRYNIIISKDHVLQEEINSPTCTLLARISTAPYH